MSKRVDFEVSTAGTINSVYLWVENKNVTLRNNKGYLFLKPRNDTYVLVHLALGRNGATVEITVKAGGNQLSKKKSTIGSDGLSNDRVQFDLEPG